MKLVHRCHEGWCRILFNTGPHKVLLALEYLHDVWAAEVATAECFIGVIGISHPTATQTQAHTCSSPFRVSSVVF